MPEILYSGEQIKQLIPQREPVMMIDRLYKATPTEAAAGLMVGAENIFCQGGRLQEMGIVEHIAQTCAAYNAMKNTGRSGNGAKPKLGYIGEVKKCTISLLPPVGSDLLTEVKVVGEAMNVTLMEALCTNQGKEVARCLIKLFEEEG